VTLEASAERTVASMDAAAELRELSDKAEAGDVDARLELRERVRACAPEQIADLATIARRADGMLIKTISGGEPTMEEALKVYMGQMRREIAGPDPTPLESMLAERVVSGWLLVEVLETLVSAQYSRKLADGARRSSPAYLLGQSKILESATRRHHQAITTLARVRKLQANVPGVQFNTQINLR
jgi:hypothetical protein